MVNPSKLILQILDAIEPLSWWECTNIGERNFDLLNSDKIMYDCLLQPKHSSIAGNALFSQCCSEIFIWNSREYRWILLANHTCKAHSLSLSSREKSLYNIRGSVENSAHPYDSCEEFSIPVKLHRLRATLLQVFVEFGTDNYSYAHTFKAWKVE